MIFSVSAFGAGDERKALAEFYAEHKGKCLKAALSITHSHALAEDAVHEAFLKMMRHKEKYFSDPSKRTGTLIVIMVKSAAIDIMRREKRLAHTALDDYEDILGNESPGAHRVAEGKEAVDRLRHHVSRLDEVGQTLFEIKYLLGKTDGEIAEMVGMKKNAVAVRIHRLTNHLREAMRKEGYFSEGE